jgi:hypothetical protein
VSAALLELLDPFAALVIAGRRVGEQRGAVISQRPDTSRAVGQQACSLQVRAGPREPVASMPTAWRLLDRIDEPHLERLRAARAAARQQAWEAGAAPGPGGELRIDFDATISIAFSEKENAAATWKKTFVRHEAPL